MVNGSPLTQTIKAVAGARKEQSDEEVSCVANGGRWDPTTNTCIMPEPAPTPLPTSAAPRVDPNIPEVIRDQASGKLTGVTLPDGRTFQNLSPTEVQATVDNFLRKTDLPEGTQPAGTSQRRVEQAFEGEQLAGQVGQTQPSPTTGSGGVLGGVDVGEAGAVGISEAIPRALTIAGGAAIAGATAGAVTTGGVASVPLAAVGAVVGFTGSISSSVLSNMKSQRSDTTRAQQRTLDEGKQAMQDWATLAASDPDKRQEYVNNFNSVLQQIQDSHVQMIVDTNKDVAKFETAVPNLAEFNSFYAPGGERDALVADMQRSVRGEVPPLESNFRMAALTNRASPNQLQSIPPEGFLGSLIP